MDIADIICGCIALIWSVGAIIAGIATTVHGYREIARGFAIQRKCQRHADELARMAFGAEARAREAGL